MSLYKYLSDSCLDPLVTGYYRFTQPIMFNDPFETRPHLSSLLGNFDIIKLFKDITDDDIDDILKNGFPSFLNKLPKRIKRNIFLLIIKYAPDEFVARIKQVERKITPIV